jgi:hypothetical protein
MARRCTGKTFQSPDAKRQRHDVAAVPGTDEKSADGSRLNARSEFCSAVKFVAQATAQVAANFSQVVRTFFVFAALTVDEGYYRHVTSTHSNFKTICPSTSILNSLVTG